MKRRESPNEEVSRLRAEVMADLKDMTAGLKAPVSVTQSGAIVHEGDAAARVRLAKEEILHDGFLGQIFRR